MNYIKVYIVACTGAMEGGYMLLSGVCHVCVIVCRECVPLKFQALHRCEYQLLSK